MNKHFLKVLRDNIPESIKYISSNAAGILEVVIPNKNGILIEPGNLEGIESAIDFYSTT